MNQSLFRVIACLIICFTVSESRAQTFDLYIANDHLVSATVYEFDEYIVGTSTMFSLRTVQNCITFNPAFINPSAAITVTMVSGSSQLTNYNPTTIQWSQSGNGFQSAANTGVSCASGTLIDNLH